MLPEMANSSMPKVISMMENGPTTKRMDMEYTQTQLGLVMKVSGKTTNSMEKELKTGQKVQGMKVNTIWA